jgi:hypothetical protein
VNAAWERVKAYAAKADPEFTPAYLAQKKVGALRVGIGSALARKVLVRVEGPSPAADDDVIIEAKEVTALRNQPCLIAPPAGEAFRVVEGVRQIGRSRHRLLVALPLLSEQRPEARGWWVKAWERSYHELELTDLASAQELREVAHDVGAQLGSTHFAESGDRGIGGSRDRGIGGSGDRGIGGSARRAELERLPAREPRILQAAHDLTAALLEAWRTIERHGGGGGREERHSTEARRHRG